MNGRPTTINISTGVNIVPIFDKCRISSQLLLLKKKVLAKDLNHHDTLHGTHHSGNGNEERKNCKKLKPHHFEHFQLNIFVYQYDTLYLSIYAFYMLYIAFFNYFFYAKVYKNVLPIHLCAYLQRISDTIRYPPIRILILTDRYDDRYRYFNPCWEGG